MWDAKSGAVLLTLRGHTGSFWSASFNRDGSRVVTAGNSGLSAKVWDAQTGAFLMSLKGHTHQVNSASFSADGSRIVTGSGDATAKIWDANSGAELLSFHQHDAVRSAAFSRDGARVVTAGNWDSAKVWDVITSAEYRRTIVSPDFENSRIPYFAPAGFFSSDESHVVVVGNAEKTVARVCDARTGKEVCILKGHTRDVTCGSFSADGSRIATGGDDRTALGVMTGLPRCGMQPPETNSSLSEGTPGTSLPRRSVWMV